MTGECTWLATCRVEGELALSSHRRTTLAVLPPPVGDRCAAGEADVKSLEGSNQAADGTGGRVGVASGAY